MATKLRKFSYSAFVKTVVILIVIGTLSGVCHSMFKAFVVAENADHSVYNTLGDNFKGSVEFDNMLTEDINKIGRLAEDYKNNDDYVYSGKAWADYEKRIRKAQDEYTEELVSDKIEEYLLNSDNWEEPLPKETEPETAANGSITEGETTAAEEAPKRLYTLDYAKLYLSADEYRHLSDEVEEIRENRKNRIEGELFNTKIGFVQEYENLKKEVFELKNVRFIYDDGETFISNVDNIEKNPDRRYRNALEDAANRSFAEGKLIYNYDIVLDMGGIILKPYSDDYGYPSGVLSAAQMLSHIEHLAVIVDTDFVQADKYAEAKAAFEKENVLVTESFIQAGVCGVIAFLGVIYLIIAAGRKDKDAPLKAAVTDRCYNDIHFYISAALALGIAFLTVFTVDSMCGGTLLSRGYVTIPYKELMSLNTKASLGVLSGGAAVSAVCLEWLLSAVRAIKAKTYIKRSLWFVICKKIFGFFKKHFNKVKVKFIAFKKKCEIKYKFESFKSGVFAFVGIFFGVNLIIMLLGGITVSGFTEALLFILIAGVFNFFIIKRGLAVLSDLDRVFTCVKKGGAGDFSNHIDWQNMDATVSEFAHDVENMQEGLKKAIDEAVKGERMKTELITNVSHDLKTPLTSIINYTDLLGRCDITDPTAKEYIGVLSEKSLKLKKLIEDLVEASKATTGNVKIEKIKMNLYEMAVQAIGENEDVLAEKGVEVRVNTPEKQPVVYADNQKTWRIIDNLFSNVRKYSLPGTRAYITVEEKDGMGVFSVKNISAEALDISPEELTERFVRGDENRSTEGSGLGLSIAKSLCELQDGRFTIDIDGDLFKATVELPLSADTSAFNS